MTTTNPGDEKVSKLSDDDLRTLISRDTEWHDCDDAIEACLIELLALRANLKLALEHILELEDAWCRGSLRSCDGKDGERSNRNVEVRVALAAAEEKGKQVGT